MKSHFTLILFIGILSLSTLFCVFAKAEEVDGSKINTEINDQVGTKTDSNTVEREEDEISSERLTAKQKEQFKTSSASHQYQAEVNQLMNIIINSLYSNTDVFLRELVSNASDALDKIRFISLSDKKALEGKPELEIRIKVDAKNKMIHIIDSGVGMTKEELIKNLGTIAKSGTKDFINKLKETKSDASNLIGQFGVGFYSSFLVADRVTVISKHYSSDKQYIWESDAGQNFNVAEDPRGNTLVRGTQITLHIKEEHKDLLETEKIENLLRRFSEFIEFPIYIWKSFQETEEIPLTEEEITQIKVERKEKREKEKQEKKSEEEVELGKDESQDKQDEEEDEKDLPKTRTEKKTVWRYEQVNTNKPIWTREKSSITDDEYKAFFKAITKDNQDPATYTHFNAEGSVNFKSILYIPKTPPSNMFDMNFKKDGLKLYVRRVFITDDFFDVLPTWLAFLKGVIDSEDMQLNVSREILQQTKSLSVLKKKVVRKAIAMMQSMAKNETSYTEFWENYSKPIKYGVLQDPSNQIRLAKLLRFSSSHNTTTGVYTSLTDYVSRMKKNQTSILYLAGDNIDKLQNSPLAETALEKGYEILYLNDAIDEYVVQGLRTFDAKYKFSNLQKEDVKLEEDKDEQKKEEEKKRQEALDEQFKELKDFLKEKLSAKISKVTLSERLTKSPAALVASTYGLSANMERIMKAQALGTAAPSRSYPTMEVNPNHPIIVELNNRLAVEGKDSPVLSNSVEILFHTSALVSGYPVDDPGYFANSIHSLLNNVLGVESKPTSTPTPTTTTTETKHDEL